MDSSDKTRFSLLVTSFSLLFSLLLPVIPQILNGAPLVGDSWSHMRVAQDTIKKGVYSFSDYNQRWPLVNTLITLTSMTTGLTVEKAATVIPLLCGLASLPLICLTKKVGASHSGPALTVFFLSFNPLYSYIIFAGSVMKETATFFPFMTSLLTLIMLKRRPGANLALTLILLGLGVILGHHYASLTFLLVLWVLILFSLVNSLSKEEDFRRELLPAALVYTVFFLFWNALNYLSIEQRFMPITLGDAVILSGLMVVVSSSIYLDRGFISSSRPWLIVFAYITAVAGLRMGVFSLLQPTPPVGVEECVNYVVAGLLGVGGLFLGLRGSYMKALASSVISLSLFPIFYGLNYFGMVLLTKSLHYLGVLLAVGAGLSVSTITNVLEERGLRWLGNLATLSMIVFLVYSSAPGTNLALKGLSAYEKGEVTSLETIQPMVDSGVKGDTRISYLLQYEYNQSLPITPQLNQFKENDLLLISEKNLEQGFLYGYDWVASDIILPELKGFDIVYSSRYIEAWQKAGATR